MPSSPMTLNQGRALVIVASILWSLSGAFTKLLTVPTSLGLSEPPIEPLVWGGKNFPMQIACYRVFFAAVFLATLVRPKDVAFRPLMLFMAACFAIMNFLFISAQALGSAANAILLQYTAPLWMYLISTTWLGEPRDRRGLITLLVGLVGIAIILFGGWEDGEVSVLLIALGSGITYGGVILCLRQLRGFSPSWLSFWNHSLAALALVPLVITLRPPTWAQFGVLFLFGSIQLGLPYFLMAKALRVVGPAEAGTLTLVELLLTPVWAYLVSGEVPNAWTFVGGAIIFAALAWRYWPRKSESVSPRPSGERGRG